MFFAVATTYEATRVAPNKVPPMEPTDHTKSVPANRVMKSKTMNTKLYTGDRWVVRRHTRREFTPKRIELNNENLTRKWKEKHAADDVIQYESPDLRILTYLNPYCYI